MKHQVDAEFITVTVTRAPLLIDDEGEGLPLGRVSFLVRDWLLGGGRGKHRHSRWRRGGRCRGIGLCN